MAQEPEGESDQLDITEEQLVSRLYAEAELSCRRGRSLDEIREMLPPQPILDGLDPAGRYAVVWMECY